MANFFKNLWIKEYLYNSIFLKFSFFLPSHICPHRLNCIFNQESLIKSSFWLSQILGVLKQAL